MVFEHKYLNIRPSIIDAGYATACQNPIELNTASQRRHFFASDNCLSNGNTLDFHEVGVMTWEAACRCP